MRPQHIGSDMLLYKLSTILMDWKRQEEYLHPSPRDYFENSVFPVPGLERRRRQGWW